MALTVTVRQATNSVVEMVPPSMSGTATPENSRP
jgi:hypothetical protein